jgi:hypothetical protein
MAYTTTQYTAICAAIGSGELMVQYDGKKVEFRSIAELLKAKANIEAELIATGQLAAPNSGGVQRGSTTYASYSPD